MTGAENMQRTTRELLDEWGLVLDGSPILGRASIVTPVTDAEGVRLMLKVSVQDDDNAGEPEALKAWRGQGAVRLERADPHRGAQLLERLSNTSLTSVDAVEASEIVGRLYARLHLPASPRLPDLNGLVRRWLDELDALGRDVPAPPRFVAQALSAGRRLASERGEKRVVHGDLHYENVLAARREPWLVIDPKGFAGDPCYELGPMLWNRWLDLGADAGNGVRERFFTIVDAAGYDERRCRDWVVVRAMIGVSWEVLDAGASGRGLTDDQGEWITRLVTVAKAMQAIGP